MSNATFQILKYSFLLVIISKDLQTVRKATSTTEDTIQNRLRMQSHLLETDL